jgi:hypothetical protein
MKRSGLMVSTLLPWTRVRLLSLLLALSGAASAQSVSGLGAIAGMVRDPSGAAVAGAVVRVT